MSKNGSIYLTAIAEKKIGLALKLGQKKEKKLPLEGL